MVHVSLHLAHIYNAISSYSAVRRFHSYNHIHTGSCSQPPLRRTQSCASPLPSLALHYSLTWLGSASAYLDTTRSHALQPSGCVVRHVLRLATPHASSTLVAPLPYLPSTLHFNHLFKLSCLTEKERGRIVKEGRGSKRGSLGMRYIERE